MVKIVNLLQNYDFIWGNGRIHAGNEQAMIELERSSSGYKILKSLQWKNKHGRGRRKRRMSSKKKKKAALYEKLRAATNSNAVNACTPFKL